MYNIVRVHLPSSLFEAAEILKNNKNTKILAGGTDLIVKLKDGILKNITELVCIEHLGLKEIKIEDCKGIRYIKLGSCCTMSQILSDQLVKENLPTLWQAASQLGSLQIRNVATIGGNVANASPAGDTIPALISLDAKVLIYNQNERKQVNLCEFFTGPGKSILNREEIIEAFLIPFRKTQGTFIKLGERRAHAIAKVSLALSCWQKNNNSYEFRIALGAVAPTVIRCPKAEEILSNASWPPSLDLIDQAATFVIDAISPIDDLRSTKNYRKRMSEVLLRRAIKHLTNHQ